jgi:biopolymer transport protein ExbD
MKYLRRDEVKADLDISPLIDMVFILLIFFMVSTTFVKDMKIDVERPSASSSKKASPKAIRVHVEKNGSIYFEGLPVKTWMLQRHVRDALKSASERPVLIVTDSRVAAEKLIEVVDQCRLAGAKDVGVATKREAG